LKDFTLAKQRNLYCQIRFWHCQNRLWHCFYIPELNLFRALWVWVRLWRTYCSQDNVLRHSRWRKVTPF